MIQQSNRAFFVTGESVLILMPFHTGIAHDAWGYNHIKYYINLVILSIVSIIIKRLT